MEDLENGSRRDKFVIWGLKEVEEAADNFFGDFWKVEFFKKRMQLQNIEVMRAHRTNVKRRVTEANTSTTRPIPIYLLRCSSN